MKHYQAVTKVAFVGAGSVEFARNLVTDVGSRPEFSGRPCFPPHDVRAGRLTHAKLLANQIARQTGSNAFVSATPDRRQALTDVNHVVTEIGASSSAVARWPPCDGN
jgi:alpha-galactosidase